MKPITITRPARRGAAAARVALTALILGAAIADPVRADVIYIRVRDPVKVPKGNTVTSKVWGMPPGIPGTMVLRIKWHAMNIVPTYPPLRVELRHGASVVLAARNCYSIHAPSTQTPKCNYTINVTATEAAGAGEWSLVVTNNSDFEVSDLAIHKNLANDLNATVPEFHSTYTTACPGTVVLDMEGSTLTLPKGSTQERRLFNIGAADGDVFLLMKWHADNLIPNTFHPLKVEVMNGTSVVATSNCYSYHASQSPRCRFEFRSGSRPATGWKLRVTNNSTDDAKEFNIRKEGDLNPFMNNFVSDYKAVCQ